MDNDKPNNSAVLRILLPLLLVLSIVELHLYRLPQAMTGTAQKGSEILLTIAHPWGTLIHALAAATAAAALVIMAGYSVKSRPESEGKSYWPLILIFALLLTSLIQTALGGNSSLAVLQVVSIILVSYMLIRFLRFEQSSSQKIIVVMLAAYQLIPRFLLMADPSLSKVIGGTSPVSQGFLVAAEAMMLIALIALIPVYFRLFLELSTLKKLRPLIAASAIFAMLAKFYLDNPAAIVEASSHISGLQFMLPFPIYLVAVWAIIFSAITMRARDDHNRSMGYALVFIFISGFLLLNPYQHLLSGLGFTLLGIKDT